MSCVLSRLKSGALLFGMTVSLSPTIATAGTCTEVIRDLSDYAVGTNYVKFMMVMNTTDMTWAQYTVGKLGHAKRDRIDEADYLTGRGKQYFSNREWSPETKPDPNPSPGDSFGGSVPSPSYPFDPNKTDDVQIDIYPASITTANLNRPSNGSVIFTALSWGNAKSSSVPECKDGLMYGFVEGGGMYVISFKKTSTEIPK